MVRCLRWLGCWRLGFWAAAGTEGNDHNQTQSCPKCMIAGQTKISTLPGAACEKKHRKAGQSVHIESRAFPSCRFEKYSWAPCERIGVAMIVSVDLFLSSHCACHSQIDPRPSGPFEQVAGATSKDRAGTKIPGEKFVPQPPPDCSDRIWS